MTKRNEGSDEPNSKKQRIEPIIDEKTILLYPELSKEDKSQLGDNSGIIKLLKRIKTDDSSESTSSKSKSTSSIFGKIDINKNPKPTLEIHQLDPGTGGDCSLILIKNDNALVKSILIDGSLGDQMSGSSGVSPLRDYIKLKLRDKKLDIIVITHFDTDHYAGIARLIEELPEESKIRSYTPEIGCDILPSTSNGGSGSISMKCISVNAKYQGGQINPGNPSATNNHKASTKTNQASIGFILEFYGFKFYTAGDLTYDVEEKLAEQIDQVDLMKVSHHGSNTSTPQSLLQKLNPRIAVISAGTNRHHNHPDREVVKRLENNEFAKRLTNYIVTSKNDDVLGLNKTPEILPENSSQKEIIEALVNAAKSKGYGQKAIFAGAMSLRNNAIVREFSSKLKQVGSGQEQSLNAFLDDHNHLKDRGNVVFEVNSDVSGQVQQGKPFITRYFTNFKKRYVNSLVEPYLIGDEQLPQYLSGARRYADENILLKSTSDAGDPDKLTLQWYYQKEGEVESTYQGSTDPSKLLDDPWQADSVSGIDFDTRCFLAITQKLNLEKVGGNGEDKDLYYIVDFDENGNPTLDENVNPKGKELEIPGLGSSANSPKLKDVKVSYVSYDENNHQITIKKATLTGFGTDIALVEKTIKPQKKQLYDLLGRPVKLPGIQKLCLYDSNAKTGIEPIELKSADFSTANPQTPPTEGAAGAADTPSPSPTPQSFELLTKVLERITAEKFKNFFDIDSFLNSGALNQALQNRVENRNDNLLQSLANGVNRALTVKQIYLDYSLNKTLHTKITFKIDIIDIKGQKQPSEDTQGAAAGSPAPATDSGIIPVCNFGGNELYLKDVGITLRADYQPNRNTQGASFSGNLHAKFGFKIDGNDRYLDTKLHFRGADDLELEILPREYEKKGEELVLKEGMDVLDLFDDFIKALAGGAGEDKQGKQIKKFGVKKLFEAIGLKEINIDGLRLGINPNRAVGQSQIRYLKMQNSVKFCGESGVRINCDSNIISNGKFDFYFTASLDPRTPIDLGKIFTSYEIDPSGIEHLQKTKITHLELSGYPVKKKWGFAFRINSDEQIRLGSSGTSLVLNKLQFAFDLTGTKVNSTMANGYISLVKNAQTSGSASSTNAAQLASNSSSSNIADLEATIKYGGQENGWEFFLEVGANLTQISELIYGQEIKIPTDDQLKTQISGYDSELSGLIYPEGPNQTRAAAAQEVGEIQPEAQSPSQEPDAQLRLCLYYGTKNKDFYFRADFQNCVWQPSFADNKFTAEIKYFYFRTSKGEQSGNPDLQVGIAGTLKFPNVGEKGLEGDLSIDFAKCKSKKDNKTSFFLDANFYGLSSKELTSLVRQNAGAIENLEKIEKIQGDSKESYLALRIGWKKSSQQSQESPQAAPQSNSSFFIFIKGHHLGNKIAAQLGKKSGESLGGAIGLYVPNLAVIAEIFGGNQKLQEAMSCMRENYLVISTQEKAFDNPYFDRPLNYPTLKMNRGLLLKTKMDFNAGFMKEVGEFLKAPQGTYLDATIKIEDKPCWSLMLAADLVTPQPIKICGNFLMRNPGFVVMATAKPSFKALIKSDFVVDLGQRTELDFRGALYFEFDQGLNVGGFLELNQPWENPLGYSNLIVNRAAIGFDYKTLPVPTLNVGLLADITLKNLTGYAAVGFQVMPVPAPKMIAASLCDTDLAEIIESITGESPPLAWILSKLKIVGVEPFDNKANGERTIKVKGGNVTKIYDLIKDQIAKEKDRGVKKFLTDGELEKVAEEVNKILPNSGFLKDDIVVFEGRKKSAAQGQAEGQKGNKFFRVEGKENVFEIEEIKGANGVESQFKVKINKTEKEVKVDLKKEVFGAIQNILQSERITKSPRILKLESSEVEDVKRAFSHNTEIQTLKDGYENFRRGASSNPKFKIPLGEQDRIYITKVKEKRDTKYDRNHKTSLYYLADGPNVYSVWPNRTSLNTQAMVAIDNIRIGSTEYVRGLEFFSNVLGLDLGIQLQVDGNFILNALAYSDSGKIFGLSIDAGAPRYDVDGDNPLAVLLKALLKVAELVQKIIKFIGDAIAAIGDGLKQIGEVLSGADARKNAEFRAQIEDRKQRKEYCDDKKNELQLQIELVGEIIECASLIKENGSSDYTADEKNKISALHDKIKGKEGKLFEDNKFKEFINYLRLINSNESDSQKLENARNAFNKDDLLKKLNGLKDQINEQVKKVQQLSDLGEYFDAFNKFIQNENSDGLVLTPNDKVKLKEFYTKKDDENDTNHKAIRNQIHLIRAKGSVLDSFKKDEKLDLTKVDLDQKLEGNLVSKLDLSRTLVSRYGVDKPSEYQLHDLNFILFFSVVDNPDLKEISLAYNKIDNDALKVVVSAISLSENTALEKLNLNGNCLQKEGVATLVENLSENNQIKHLGLSHNQISCSEGKESELLKLLFKTKNIEELDIGHNPGVSESINSWLCASDESKKTYKNLKSLSLANTQIDQQKFSSLSSSLANVTNLETLNLSHNNLSQVADDKLQKFAKYLQKPKTKLKNLDLSNNNLGSYDVKQDLENLSELGLTHAAPEESSSPSQSHQPKIAKILNQNKEQSDGNSEIPPALSFEKLNLSLNNLSDGDLSAVFISLQTQSQPNSQITTNLQELNLFGNPISDKSLDLLIKIAEAMSKNLDEKIKEELKTKIQELQNLESEIGNESDGQKKELKLQQLAQEEQKIEKITQQKVVINIGKCAISEAGKEKLTKALQKIANQRIDNLTTEIGGAGDADKKALQELAKNMQITGNINFSGLDSQSFRLTEMPRQTTSVARLSKSSSRSMQ